MLNSYPKNFINDSIPIPVNVLSTSGTVSLKDNSVYRITQTAAITFSLPTSLNNSLFHQILVQLNLSTVYTVSLGTSKYFGSSVPSFSEIGMYDIVFEHNGSNWVAGSIKVS